MKLSKLEKIAILGAANLGAVIMWLFAFFKMFTEGGIYMIEPNLAILIGETSLCGVIFALDLAFLVSNFKQQWSIKP